MKNNETNTINTTETYVDATYLTNASLELLFDNAAKVADAVASVDGVVYVDADEAAWDVIADARTARKAVR